MDDMREILDERTLEEIMRALAIGGPLLGLAVGGGLGVWRKKLRFYLLRGLMVGSLGVLNLGLWRLYSFLVRYDPQTHYWGLEQVRVLLLNLFLFTAVGVIIGFLWARTASPPEEPRETSALAAAEDPETDASLHPEA